MLRPAPRRGNEPVTCSESEAYMNASVSTKGAQSTGELDVEDRSISVTMLDTHTDELTKSLESDWIHNPSRFLWLLLFSAIAECVTTCYTPEIRIFSINVSATALNLVGCFLDGMFHSLENSAKEMSCSVTREFRSAYLGVLTSYSFLVDHARDLSEKTFFYGYFYILLSLIGGCLSFSCGRLLTRSFLKLPIAPKAYNAISPILQPNYVPIAIVFICLTILRATFGPEGFVRDPKDTQFIGTFKVHDGQELILGIFMSCSAILWSEHIYDRLQGTRFLSVDWSSLSCNALSCFLLYGTYTAKIYFPDLIEHNLLMLKFVSSFCGSLSCLSACITHMSVLWMDGKYLTAVLNFVSQTCVAFAFINLLLSPN
ncbi:unnamed protein product [Albugo candida]|uniref:Uncharacterized protein n=1 Tax=Albugo candida TaxID=65357 RepID=A0A024GC86_9STRA|nr:unnamed protein product [Albugo candida]|eukprot:CCI44454.1 unnamed protein product [Albugo candida]